jgi:cell pole-organizing protein PopZ
MTQPAKVQEPSMEEILASIRRIIADDEAKPAAAEKAAPPPPSPQPASPPPPSPSPAAAAAKPEKPAPAPAARAPVAPPPAAPAPAKAAAPIAPPPAPAVSNSQDDIDALLNGLDEATTPEEIRPAAPEPEPEADVLDLTDEMALPDPAPQAAFRKVEPPDDLEFTETAAKAPLRDMAFDLPPPSPMDSPPILSRSTVSAVESAFNSLAHTVLSNNARTLEDLVKEMLRPMLKSWLDDNLPRLVERIVKAEIERVSRGR